jgi:hypothetical protein
LREVFRRRQSEKARRTHGKIKKTTPGTPREIDLFDNAAALLVWAMKKLVRLRIIAKSDSDAKQQSHGRTVEAPIRSA